MKRRHGIALFVTVAGCAQMVAPPGGPPDPKPPGIMGVFPDSGAVRAHPKEVVFAFDEVVSDQVRGAPSLQQSVLISPNEGDPVVRWHRSRITVRPAHGWRENTTYVVTLLPGITDLRGNKRDSNTVVVFSTGESIPRTRVTGVVFDWMKAITAPRTFIEAHPGGDTTITFQTEADSAGRFTLPFLTPGSYLIRALVDVNHNRRVDGRELWDTATVQLRDNVVHDFYTVPHDSVGPRVLTVAPLDSLTLRVSFDKPLSPDSTYLPQIEIRAADSSLVPIARISTWAAFNAAKDARTRIARDSTLAADTNSANRAKRELFRTDSINRAAEIADSLARDTTRRVLPPKSARPALVTEVAVELQHPLPTGVAFGLRATAIGVDGKSLPSPKTFTLPKPPPVSSPPKRPDSTSVPPIRARRP